MISCGIKFRNEDSENSKKNTETASCFLNNLNEIQDDSSGTKVVTRCAESTNNATLGFVLSKIFSPSARIEKKMEDIAEENNAIQRNRLLPNISNLPNGDGLTIMNINGEMKTCMKIGVLLDCN
jgi:hypothetical protein